MALFGTGALVDPSRAKPIDMKAPVINKPGAAGFFERVLDPSTNNNPLGRALGMFGQGLMAQQPGVGGDIGRSLMGMHQQNRQDETTLLQRALMQARIEAEDRRANLPKVMSGPNGAILSVDPATQQVTPIYEGQQAPTTLQRQFEWLKSLPPEDQKAARAMLPGFGYTPEGINMTVERAAAVANAQGAARAAHRAPEKPQYEYRTGPDGQLQRRRVN